MHIVGVVFFFSSRRRHTRFDCDWSSDVCSSDLAEVAGGRAVPVELPSEVNPRLPSLFQPASFAAEQYRGLRHVVEQIRKSAGISVLAVSSPTVHDGKTTTAINLAGALAQASDRQGLPVQADPRRPPLLE